MTLDLQGLDGFPTPHLHGPDMGSMDMTTDQAMALFDDEMLLGL